MSQFDECKEPRKCFAKHTGFNHVRCTILTECYPRGENCPFCKPKREESLSIFKYEQPRKRGKK